MTRSQPGILGPVPRAARYLTLRAQPGADLRKALRALAKAVDGEEIVAGIGCPVVQALGRDIPGLRSFPVFTAPAIEVPSTPRALWCWLRGTDPGDLLHRSRALTAALSPGFVADPPVDAFRHGSGRDLTGYEDGTENPKGRKAAAAAIHAGGGRGLDGSSFVAVQQWVHDFARFDALSRREQDHAVGRRRSDNAELDRAPASAHVKRTAQESFSPEAFVVRRSMPWSDAQAAGLMFVAFGRSLDAFEAQMRRMAGMDDGITDALFRFTRPVTGSYFWCPPVADGGLDLSALGL